MSNIETFFSVQSNSTISLYVFLFQILPLMIIDRIDYKLNIAKNILYKVKSVIN